MFDTMNECEFYVKIYPRNMYPGIQNDKKHPLFFVIKFAKHFENIFNSLFIQ